MKTIERENICIRDWIQEPEKGCVVSPLVNGGAVIEVGKAPLNLTGLDLGLGTTVVRMYRCPIGDAYDRLEQIAKMLSDPGSQKRFLRAYKELSATLDAEFHCNFSAPEKKAIKRETGCIIGNGSFLKTSTDDKERYPYLCFFLAVQPFQESSRMGAATKQPQTSCMILKWLRNMPKEAVNSACSGWGSLSIIQTCLMMPSSITQTTPTTQSIQPPRESTWPQNHLWSGRIFSWVADSGILFLDRNLEWSTRPQPRS